MTMIIKASIGETNIGSNSMVINLIIMKILCMELGQYVPYVCFMNNFSLLLLPLSVFISTFNTFCTTIRKILI